MGKKSLIKSTTKKKAKPKKAEESKKKTATKAAAKPAKKAAAKPAKKAAAKPAKKAAAKPKASAKKKASPKTQKKLSVKELLAKKFEPIIAVPELKAAPAPKAVPKSAPPLISTTDPKEKERIGALLAKQFSMDEIKAAATPPKKAAEKTAKAKSKAVEPKAEIKKKASPKPAKKVSIKELLSKKFEPFQAATEVKPAPAPKAAPGSAPPLISTTDPKEKERISALLAKQFSMDEIKMAAKEPTPKPVADAQPAVEKETPEAPPSDDAAVITIAPTEKSGADPVSSTVKLIAAGIAILVLLVMGLSYNNSAKYYIQSKDGAIEIWKGSFSPKDTHLVFALPGVQAPDPAKEIYTKQEVLPLICGFYLDKADTLLEVRGLPDFEAIRDHLYEAKEYAVTAATQESVVTRLNNIQRMILLYKADVNINKGTDGDLQLAIKQLKEAGQYTTGPTQSDEIAKKLTFARERRTALKAEAAK